MATGLGIHVAAVLSLLAGGAAAWWVVRSVSRAQAGRRAAEESLAEIEGPYRSALARLEGQENAAQAEVQRLNRELERSAAELKAVHEELEAFSYSVSHDLRAPLRHINGFVDLLRRGYRDRLDETGQRQLETIARAARQMGDLIDDLLAFSRVSRTALRQEPLDLAFLVREVVQPFGVESTERPIEWRIGELPQLRGDRALLRIVLTNLVSNAVKYTHPRPQPRIEIGSRPGEDGEVVVYVRDNGVGFDMQYAGKLFGVFQRLHRADEYEGTGIGLATVRRIVNRHGGRTWAEAKPDEGATFYFALPLAGAPSEAGAAGPGTSSEPTAGERSVP